MNLKNGHALLVLAILAGFSLGSITVLAFTSVPIPDVLAATLSTLVGGVVGVAIPRASQSEE